MNGALTYLTLPTADLDVAVAFYESVFGWPGPRLVQDARFFEFPNLTVALMKVDAFNRFTGCDPIDPQTVNGLCSWNVPTLSAARELISRAVDSGAVIPREIAELPWGGWAGIIRTPDGHLWEIVWNPKLS